MISSDTASTTKPIATFLAELSRQNIKLWMEGDRLRCSGPDAILTPELSAQLKARKTEIVSFLQQTRSAQAAPAITPVPRDQTIPLSFAQQRLWFLHQMQPESAVYNLPMAIRVEGFLAEAAFIQSLNEIVRRHEILRTRFVTEELSPEELSTERLSPDPAQAAQGQPVQVIAEAAPLNIEQVDLQNHPSPEEAVKQAAVYAAKQPFNLSQDQLLRVTLLKIKEDSAVVLFTIHHIIADGWSQEILIQELAVLYRAALMGRGGFTSATCSVC